MAVQLPLQFDLQSENNFDSFFPASNQELLEHLQRFIHDKQELQLYVWGETGLGKTHLLQACCQQAQHIGRQAFYLNLSDANPEILEGLDAIELVCLDNVDQIAGNADWEHALFNFYNRLREREHQLLLTASCPPRYLPFMLHDLKTRMSWGLTLKLKILSDAEMIAAFRLKAQSMGIEVPDRIARFLQHHYQRNLSGLWQLLDKIAQTTLMEKRKLSVAMIKRIIDQNGPD